MHDHYLQAFDSLALANGFLRLMDCCITDYVIETMLGEKRPPIIKIIMAGILLIWSAFVGLKAMSPFVTNQHKIKHPAYCNIHCVHNVLVSLFNWVILLCDFCELSSK